MKNAYNYHPVTGEFTSSFEPDYSPLEPDVPLLPQFSTMEAPPRCAVREVAVFRSGEWARLPDWRGVSLYSTQTGAATAIEEIGIAPEDVDATDAPRPTPNHVWLNGAWALDEQRKRDAFVKNKAMALNLIDKFHADVVQQLVGDPTQVEKDTWALKLEVANAITSKAAVSAAGQAFLSSAGIVTDVAKSAWAASVLAKSSAYAQVVGLAEKLRDTARTAVKAATDEVSLKAALDAQRAAADAAVASLLKGT
jgi:hypothetical protein